MLFAMSIPCLSTSLWLTQLFVLTRMAPQVLQGVYSSQADLWAVGVLAFMMLSASKPFHHKRRRVVSRQYEYVRSSVNNNYILTDISLMYLSDGGQDYASCLQL
jgi:serine/threonine protein kinase